MPRVVLVCTDNVVCDGLRQAFQFHTEFEIHGGAKNSADTIAKATELCPDLVVLEMASDSHGGFDTAERLKRILPGVPLFLVTQEHTMAAEREALHNGIDAVF